MYYDNTETLNRRTYTVVYCDLRKLLPLQVPKLPSYSQSSDVIVLELFLKIRSEQCLVIQF